MTLEILKTKINYYNTLDVIKNYENYNMFK